MLAVMHKLNTLSANRLPWGLLALSASGLLVSALYFQHAMDLQPCIKCIYQRTAVIGILLAALLPLVYNNIVTRLLALCIWGYSAYQGLLSAREHLEVIYAENPFFAVCDFVPNFPSHLPLHEWMPAVFAATGDCDDNTWKFMDMGMASWLQIIFIAYLCACGVIAAAQLFNKK